VADGLVTRIYVGRFRCFDFAAPDHKTSWANPVQIVGSLQPHCRFPWSFLQSCLADVASGSARRGVSRARSFPSEREGFTGASVRRSGSRARDCSKMWCSEQGPGTAARCVEVAPIWFHTCCSSWSTTPLPGITTYEHSRLIQPHYRSVTWKTGCLWMGLIQRRRKTFIRTWPQIIGICIVFPCDLKVGFNACPCETGTYLAWPDLLLPNSQSCIIC
jgi:hypothetical protein